MDIVNELTTYRVVAEFMAEDGAPVVPSQSSYRLDDVLSDTQIIDDTNFTPSGSTHVITIPHASMNILDDGNDLEERVLTVIAPYGTAKQCTGEFRFKVRNLSKVPSPVTP